MDVRILGLIALVALLLPTASLVVPVAVAGDSDEVVEAGEGTVNITVPVLSFEDALNLAYTVRNLTYELFQWEISRNVTAANVTLTVGDRFLARALELKDNATRKATVFAVVAAIHYGHAPAFAHPVLARVVKGSLGENGTVTADTVNAVLSASSELKSILLNAVGYAESKGYNTTLAEAWIARGDNATATAQQLLAAGNVTAGFRHAVAGYRMYVKAYSVLVKTVFAQFLRDLGIVRAKAFLPPGLIDKLPVELRSELKARIEKGEVKSIRDVVGEVRKEIQLRAEERREREYRQVASIMAAALAKLSRSLPLHGRQLYDFCYDIVRDVASRTNATGLQLLQLSLQELQGKLSNLNIQQEFQSSVVKIRVKH
ncbi:hypothetical protein [Desulfurococcus mucosus]|uniref:Uncharacterized protein n=1 Tax=Desulfurococcus mucosus (strain ATCC 35584 / DSM 2162 / JCM 9187 / O7/1) TaxID=765177 RepID=E8RA38_DESM0|nr:hypothetical protein [Desulfurococcus mucosus]ADV65364.1 hypothetical protein Desmu_1062 [Desulfurococcus mucosus DSM 2162]